MREEVSLWCKSCKVCASKKNPRINKANLHPITEPSNAFEMLGIDFLGPLPVTDNGNRYILVLTDYATRWPEAFPTKDMKAETVAHILINEVICRHSAPRTLLSDQGKDFLSRVVREVCEYFRTKNKYNGLSPANERFDREVQRDFVQDVGKLYK